MSRPAVYPAPAYWSGSSNSRVIEVPMRWFVALYLVCLLALPAVAQDSKIAAVVNSDIVTADDLAARLKLVMKSSNIPDTPQNEEQLTTRVLRSMIDEKLQMQELKHLNLKVSDDDVANALTGIEQRNNMPKGGLDAFLKQADIPRATLVDQITASIAWEKLVHYRLSQEVTISDEEVEEALSRLKQQVGQAQSHVSEIFLAIDNPSQQEEVHQLANKLIDQISGGAKFNTVAAQFSQSPSAAVGGDIGWITPDQLGSPLGDAIGKMNPGEMSFPIRTSAGYYVFYVSDRRTLGVVNTDDTLLSLAEVVFPLSPTATAEEHRTVESQANDVSQTAKSCGEMAKLGRERAPQLSTSIPQLKAGELPPDLRPQILALKIAEASKPVPLRGGIGVIMICQRQDPSGGMPSRDDVMETLGRERLDALARRYLRDLNRVAFVDVRG